MSTEVLQAHLDEKWVIVDCRFDLKNEAWGREQYALAHVPGAQYADLTHDLSGKVTGRNGRHPLPSTEAMAETFGRLGIAAGTQVVAYDQDVGSFASRLWWMLRYLGHDAVAVLDGGWAKWTREERPVRGGHEARVGVVFEPRARPARVADIAQVKTALTDSSSVLIDARAPERFEGRSEPLDRVGGHIPGARNRHYKDNVAEDGTILPPQTLQKTFEAVLGARTPAQTIMYCGSGVTACHNILAMTHAGLDGARLYPGSWSEWSSDPTRPVEKGPEQ